MTGPSAICIDCTTTAFMVSLDDEVLVVTADRQRAWRFAVAIQANIGVDCSIPLHICSGPEARTRFEALLAGIADVRPTDMAALFG